MYHKLVESWNTRRYDARFDPEYSSEYCHEMIDSAYGVKFDEPKEIWYIRSYMPCV